MKTGTSGALVIAPLAVALAAFCDPAAAQSTASSEDAARQTTAAVAAETKTAAEALASKFSGGATQPDAPQEAAKDAAPLQAEPRPATPPMMTALSESARAAGDHAAANATFAKQAQTSDEPGEPQVKARKKPTAKRNFVVLSGGPSDAAQAPKHPPSAPAEKPDGKPDDQPGLLAKIFSPVLSILPTVEGAEDGPDTAAAVTRSALQAGAQ